MTGTNPIMLRQPKRSGEIVTKESLEAYAEELNKMGWVKASGQPYFVNRKVEENEVKHFLDRKISS